MFGKLLNISSNIDASPMHLPVGKAICWAVISHWTITSFCDYFDLHIGKIRPVTKDVDLLCKPLVPMCAYLGGVDERHTTNETQKVEAALASAFPDLPISVDWEWTVRNKLWVIQKSPLLMSTIKSVGMASKFCVVHRRYAEIPNSWNQVHSSAHIVTDMTV